MAVAVATEVRVLEGQERKAVVGRGLYKGLCLGCGGVIEDSFLLLGIPLCGKCLRKVVGEELASEFEALLRDYESHLFVSEWLKSVKSVLEGGSVDKDVLESLAKVLGLGPGARLEDVMRVLEVDARKIEDRAGRLLEKLASVAQRVRQAVWGAKLSILEEFGGEFKKLVTTRRLVEGFEKFFEICVRNKPWSIQRAWMYRLVQGQSFAMIAPTGVGKTTFGLVSAIYLALINRLWLGRRFRTYVIVPTRVLVKQYYERAKKFVERLLNRVSEVAEIVRGLGVEVSDEEVKAVLEEVSEGIVSIPPPSGVSRFEVELRVLLGNFDLLITTSAYIHAKFNRVLKKGAHPLALPFAWALPGFNEMVRALCSGELELPESKRVQRIANKVCEERVLERLTRERIRVDYAFVDDVDAIMKGSKLIDYVLQLVGFDMGIAIEVSEGGAKVVSVEASKVKLEDVKKLFKYVQRGDEVRVKLEELEEFVKSLRDRDLVDFAERVRRASARSAGKWFKSDVGEVVARIGLTYASRLVEKELEARRKGKGIVVVSSATGRARGRRIRFFRYLLGFDIGGRLELYRKIVDCYKIVGREDFENRVIDRLIEVVELLKRDGGLIFVPIDLGAEFAERIASELRARGIKAEAVTARKPSVETIDRFRSGEIEVLVGVAIYYGLLVRGLDLPERVRYAIFVGVPRHKINISRVEYSPTTLLRLLGVLIEVVPEEERKRMETYMANLRRMLRTLSAGALKEIVEAVERGATQTKYQALLREVHDYVQGVLSRKEIVEALRRNPNVAVVEEDGTLYMLIPDAPTYIQASGRTSRLFAGGITQGISVVLVDDERLLRGLERRLRFYIDDFAFRNLDELVASKELERILEEVEKDRELVKKVLSGEAVKVGASPMELVKTVLIVVESPNKARTIARFFGRPSYRDLGPSRVYEVDLGNLHLAITASGGHVYDVVEYGDAGEAGLGVVDGGPEIFGIKLVPRTLSMPPRVSVPAFVPIYGSMKRCLLCGRQFVVHEVCPRCRLGYTHESSGKRFRIVVGEDKLRVLTKDSGSVVSVLKRLAMEVDEVLIGTDPDAEGEKIGFDLAITLAPFARRIQRMEFHEVTRKAISRAIEELRGIDINMVEAQIARRIEDRWIGFALSDYLRMKLAAVARIVIKTLSAGRVQTPTLGYVVRKNYLHSETERYYARLQFSLDGDGRKISIYIAKAASPEAFRVIARKAPREKGREKGARGGLVEIVLEKVGEEEVEIPPPPPFTTDELLTEASTVLRMSVERAMAIAQQLFEMGLITYHRTDSTRVSDAGIAVARQYLESVGMQNLFQPRTWAKGIVGAHECIRPTRPIDAERLKQLVAEGVIELPQRLTEDHYRLYDLVFRRFMASQMKGVGKAKRVKLVLKSVEGVDLSNAKRVEVVETVLGTVEVPLITDVEVFVVPEEEARNSFLSIYVPPYLAGKLCRREIGRELKVVAEVARLSTISLCVRTPTEGDIVRWMKAQNVGRPSTYAKIVATLFDRAYLWHIENMYVIASDRGRLVYAMLTGGILPPDEGEGIEVEREQVEKIHRVGIEKWLEKVIMQKDEHLKLKFGAEEYVVYVKMECSSEDRLEGKCFNLRDFVEDWVVDELSKLVLVRTTASLIKAMEEIERGARFYHTVLEGVLAEIWKLFKFKLSSMGEEAGGSDFVAQRASVYRRFCEELGRSGLGKYMEFLEKFHGYLEAWLSRELAPTQRSQVGG